MLAARDVLRTLALSTTQYNVSVRVCCERIFGDLVGRTRMNTKTALVLYECIMTLMVRVVREREVTVSVLTQSVRAKTIQDICNRQRCKQSDRTVFVCLIDFGLLQTTASDLCAQFAVKIKIHERLRAGNHTLTLLHCKSGQRARRCYVEYV
jgi:hypothetical protein